MNADASPPPPVDPAPQAPLRRPPAREPIFNVPAAVLLTIGLCAGVHAVRMLLLDPRQDMQFLLLFAFIPARYDAALLTQGGVPGGFGAELWTFVSYAFIHGDLTHLGLNCIWLLAFGSAVARRFGFLRFLAFFAVTAAAGAGLHLATHAGDYWPVVGASAAISGCMAAAARFMFQPGGALDWRSGNRDGPPRPAPPLLVTLRDTRVLFFLGVWFAVNLVFGVGSLTLSDGEQSIAWQAHIGGFIAGLLLFALFDPAKAVAFDPGGGDDAVDPRSLH